MLVSTLCFFESFSQTHLIKLFHSDLVSLENASQCGQTDSLNVVNKVLSWMMWL